MIDISIGYVPLTDAATLIAAADFGFAEAEGLNLQLQKDVSWANLRDKLAVGHLDAAHLLAPLAVATSAGIGQLRRELRAIFVLSANGNAVTLSRALAREVAETQGASEDWKLSAKALAKIVARRKAAGQRPLTFATVFPFSSHTTLLRRFFAEGGIDASEIEIVVVPPPYMVDSMDKGLIDGFCVGSPWNSLAVDQGKGVIAALACEIVPEKVEKVLAVPADSPLFRNGAGEKLIRALAKAAAFAADHSQHAKLADALAARYELPSEILLRTLSGKLIIDSEGHRRSSDSFIRFHGDGLNRPDATEGLRIWAEMKDAGQIAADAPAPEAVAHVFDASLYDRSQIRADLLKL